MFKGAGILFLKKVGSKNFISLGKRTINPHKDYWSVPGGKLDSRDNNDFFKCAIRETGEEYFYDLRNDFEIVSQMQFNKECIVNVPFIFEFHTYLIDITGLQIEFFPNWEFEKIVWFDSKQLPEKTHLGVYYAIWNFGL